MTERVPLFERVATFRKTAQTTVDQKATPPLTNDEKKALGKEASNVLSTLLGISERFLVSEDINQLDRREVSSVHCTPSVVIPDSSGNPFPAILITSTRSHYFDAFPAYGEQIASIAQVEGAIVLVLPEIDSLVPLITITGIEDTKGNVQASSVRTTDSFFSSSPNQIQAVQEALTYAEWLGNQLKDVHRLPLSRKGQQGHLLTVTDPRHGKQTIFVPHEKAVSPPSSPAKPRFQNPFRNWRGNV